MTLRRAILNTLKENPGAWVSGEALSDSLNVSRTAIWKQIKHLLDEGYEIESAPKKGYRMRSTPDLLSPDEVCADLATAVFGQQDYFYFREIDSTNNYARDAAREGVPEGTIVVAEMQTAGRGRRGRGWFSPSRQGIYMSIILRPDMPLPQLARIPLVAAVALAETIRAAVGLDARIKWPNDILVNNKKIAGILSEAVADMDGIDYVVVGFGLNFSNDPGEFPPDLRMPATSVQAEGSRPFSRVGLMQDLLYNLEQSYQQLLAGNFDTVLAKARELSMVIGQNVRLETNQGHIIGKAIDLNENGYLVVVGRGGSVQTVMSGEIEVIDSANASK
ncbi:MAG: biotin--[acetyl-CoA-carboxylase] ligase [Syntrophomonadaceae bacterium]